nr:KAAdult enhancer factor 1 [Biomphalaria glabrata]
MSADSDTDETESQFSVDSETDYNPSETEEEETLRVQLGQDIHAILPPPTGTTARAKSGLIINIDFGHIKLCKMAPVKQAAVQRAKNVVRSKKSKTGKGKSCKISSKKLLSQEAATPGIAGQQQGGLSDTVENECRQFISSLVAKLLDKSPVMIRLVQKLSCLNPSLMASSPQLAASRFRDLLIILGDSGRISLNECDQIYNKFVQCLEALEENNVKV